MTTATTQRATVFDELKRLTELHGGTLLPSVVVDAARADHSPLHHLFEWDDTAAAEQWRLLQARNVINAVVTYEKHGDNEIAVRAFVSLPSDRGENGYRLTVAVMSDAERRLELLTEARAEMLRFKDKYKSLSELASVFEAIDSAVQEKIARSA